ncbi:MAG: hypothetical protein EXR00_08230 [Alphaproteobacteria bacterium]|nr:hypothetical protein [Alphaproteobacteria bacterium]
MALSAKCFLVASGVLLATVSAYAAAVDDANSAVRAARDGKYEEAIELFTSAINTDELNLKGRAQAYAYRGIAKAAIGNYESANEDLNSAVVLDSEYSADAYAYRGYFRMVQGRSREGAADLEKSAEQKVWSYNAIWLHLARIKAGLPDTDGISLGANATMLNLNAWPGPVIRYLLGQGTQEAMTAAAQEGDPTRLIERVCDVNFYVAEKALTTGDVATARPLLQKAADKCPFASFERMGAIVELARLK